MYSHPLFHEGFATRSKATTNGTAALSTGKSLEYHLDLENLRDLSAVPEFLMLGCLRGDDRMITKILENKDILSWIPTQIRETLREKRFLLPNKEYAFFWPEMGQPILYDGDEAHHQGPTIMSLVDGVEAIRPADPTDRQARSALLSLQTAIRKADAMNQARCPCVQEQRSAALARVFSSPQVGWHGPCVGSILLDGKDHKGQDERA